MTPDLVKVSNLTAFKLDTPLPLQLACKGSRSKLINGTQTSVETNGFRSNEFFDIVNLDRYDCVLGTPFLCKHNAVIDFGANTISINGTTIKGLSDEEEAAYSKPKAKRLPPASVSPSRTANVPSDRATQASSIALPPQLAQTAIGPTPPPVADPSLAPTPPLELLEERRNFWREEFKPIFGPPFNSIPLPPLREVNHEIPLIDTNKRYHYRTPKCAEAFRAQLTEKTQEYVNSGRWVPTTVRDALPLLCLPKKDGWLRTVVDARERNENSHLDVTPLPDQDIVRNAVAKAKFRSKIDMTDAFEQIRVIPEHELRSAFVSVLGTFVSRVIQQGDLNGPSTCQRLLTHIFRERIGRSFYVYLDDIFIFTNTYEEHEENLRWGLLKLKEAQLFISARKLDVYSNAMDCLGHLIDDKGLHSDSDKMSRLLSWPTPTSYRDVQSFLGLAQYLQAFMPDVSSYASILSGMCANGRKFVWRGIHQKAFDSILNIASQKVILRPIDASRDEPIWLICDASTSGIGVILAQGPTWETARPAAFMSKKFSAAQRAYYPMELEALAALEGVEKFRDKLVGNKFTIVTDHQALEFFRNRRPENPRHLRWVQRFNGLNFDFLYIRGKTNTAADALSRRFASTPRSNTDDMHEFVDIDIRLDPEGEDLPYDRLAPADSPIAGTKYRVVDINNSSRSRLAMVIPSSDMHLCNKEDDSRYTPLQGLDDLSIYDDDESDNDGPPPPGISKQQW